MENNSKINVAPESSLFRQLLYLMNMGICTRENIIQYCDATEGEGMSERFMGYMQDSESTLNGTLAEKLIGFIGANKKILFIIILRCSFTSFTTYPG